MRVESMVRTSCIDYYVILKNMGSTNTTEQNQQNMNPTDDNSDVKKDQPVIESNQQFSDLPELVGPDNNGYYYHKDDQNSDNVAFKFKYNAIDYENIQANDNQNNDEKKDENELNNGLINTEYNKCRYDWIYTAPDDIPSHNIKEPTYFDTQQRQMITMPNKYEKIRLYLLKNDPIPQYFLRRAKMAGIVFQQACGSRLCGVRKFKCRIATKFLGQQYKVKAYHPALLLWDAKDSFLKYSDSSVMMIHLTKLNDKYKDDEEKKTNKDRIEIECKPIFKDYLVNNKKWKYDYEEQDLELENGLLDIAHWCLKYEIDNKYQYTAYLKNCRRFMIHLCDAFKIRYDAKQWIDTVANVAEKAQNKFTVKAACIQKDVPLC
eukprot:292821_1